jgi:hypothetical protein
MNENKRTVAGFDICDSKKCVGSSREAARNARGAGVGVRRSACSKAGEGSAGAIRCRPLPFSGNPKAASEAKPVDTMGNALRRETAVYRASCAFSLTCNEGTSFVLKLYSNDTFVLMWERGANLPTRPTMQRAARLHSDTAM